MRKWLLVLFTVFYLPIYMNGSTIDSVSKVAFTTESEAKDFGTNVCKRWLTLEILPVEILKK